MKVYPSVPLECPALADKEVYAFSHVSGVQIQWEWAKTKGWFRQAVKDSYFDDTYEDMVPVISEFFSNFAQPLACYATKRKYKRCTAFTIYGGKNSSGNWNHPSDKQKSLTFVDLFILGYGFIQPSELVKINSLVHGAQYLGKHTWTPEFVAGAREQQICGIGLSGVVVKRNVGRKRLMGRVRTKAWEETIRKMYPSSLANSMITR